MDAVQVNGWLALWGAIGPVLVAAISTWFNRRNQVADRKFNAEWDVARRGEERNAALDERIRLDAMAAVKWRRQTFIDFLSASFDFIHQRSGQQEHESRERHRERLAQSFATLVILDTEISDEASALWKACNDAASLRDEPDSQLEVSKKLAEARGAFAAKASQIMTAQMREIDLKTGFPRDRSR